MCFKVFNIKIQIEFGFVIVLAFALISNNDDVLYVLLFSSLHEIGHLVTLYLFGGKAEKLNVSFYGIGLINKCNLSFAKEMIFLLSGVIVNIVFASFSVCRQINLSLAIINLLPIYPLDGGRAFKLILNNLFSLNFSDFVYYLISSFVALLIIIYCIYSKNIGLIVILGYLIGYSISNTVE